MRIYDRGDANLEQTMMQTSVEPPPSMETGDNQVITKPSSPPRTRRRLSRTLSRSRWKEYHELLRIALEQGYAVVSLEAWLADASIAAGRPLLLLRHDVDQHPRSALRMAAIEAELGVLSTWYFRWRTASTEVVSAIREAGHAVGLHYETLTREILRRGLTAADAPPLIPAARELLRRELTAFEKRHGPMQSACPHGDTRVPGVHNGVLLLDQDWSSYGLRWDANAAMRAHRLDVWLTDRSIAEGRWKEGLDPIDLLIDRRSPILAVVHPNNWVSGLSLWRDRVLRDTRQTCPDTPALADGAPEEIEFAGSRNPVADQDGANQHPQRTLSLQLRRQLDYPQCSQRDGFTSTVGPETIILADQATVQRPDLLNLTIQPDVVNPRVERETRVMLPQDYLADPAVATRLPGAILDTASFLIMPTEREYIFDSVRHLGALPRFGYELLEGGTIEREVTAITERDERVVVLGAQSNANYSHWLLESLVRALLFRPYDDGSRLYLTPRLNSWQRETLELIGLGQDRILECKPSGFVRFGEVVAVSRAMMNIYTFIPAAIDALAALAKPTSQRRRIYSSRARANVRHITNDAEISELLARHGFEVVYPELLSIREQIQLFAGAETVLGVHGSGLTNTIFSPPGTTVIELQPEGFRLGENAVVRTLTAIRGQPFVQAVCALTEGMEDLPLAHRDITVDPEQLEEQLYRVLPG
jgi:hypothetical protein